MNYERHLQNSYANQELLKAHSTVGCYACIKLSDYGDLIWVDEDGASEKTAVCPHCNTDAVIPVVSLSKLRKINKYAFSTESSELTPVKYFECTALDYALDDDLRVVHDMTIGYRRTEHGVQLSVSFFNQEDDPEDYDEQVARTVIWNRFKARQFIDLNTLDLMSPTLSEAIPCALISDEGLQSVVYAWGAKNARKLKRQVFQWCRDDAGKGMAVAI